MDGNLSLRREDCLRIGLGNPDYGTLADAYHVDRDFGLRCLEGGLLGVHDRSIRADHVMTRSLESFLATSAAQGAGVVGLHRMHPNVLGPMSPERFLESLPRPLRALTRTRAATRPFTGPREFSSSDGFDSLERSGSRRHSSPQLGSHVGSSSIVARSPHSTGSALDGAAHRGPSRASQPFAEHAYYLSHARRCFRGGECDQRPYAHSGIDLSRLLQLGTCTAKRSVRTEVLEDNVGEPTPRISTSSAP